MGPDTLPGGGLGAPGTSIPSKVVVKSATTIGFGWGHFRLDETFTSQRPNGYVATPCRTSSNTSRERGNLMANTVPIGEVRATLTTPP
jgi:hypothetical protein